LPTSFAVNLSAGALSIALKVEFNFEVIVYIAIFVFLSPGNCFKSAICIQNLLDSALIENAAVEGRKSSSPDV